LRTYESYLGRSQGAGGHEKPWHYYLALIFWRREGFVWTQALIGGLAVVGMMNAFLDRRRANHKRAFLVALSTYALVLLAIYRVIPYKTPWSIMGVVHVLALLAGLGARTIFRAFTDVPAMKFVLALALAAGVYNLCHQSSYAIDFNYAGVTRYAASEVHNPYAYSHTGPSLVTLSSRIHDLAASHPAGKAMPVLVIQSEQGWPLPWYLRDLTHVGYRSEIPDKIDAAVVVVDMDKADAVLRKLGEGWKSSPWGLRSGITLSLLVEESLAARPAGDDSAPAPAQAPESEPGTAPSAPVPVGTPLPSPPDATTPQPGATAMPPPAADPAVPKAQLVEDDPPLVGPPYPVPAPDSPPN
jgi:predicted membrane-bound mannosyltransferase